MRSTVKVAALVAGLFGVVTASSCVESNGNWYCNQVEAVTYLNLGGSGSYNRVSSMNGATGVCNMTTYNYSGTNAPFDEELSLHFRGPLALKQFAWYTPSISNAKRSVHQHEHEGKAAGHHHDIRHQRRAATSTSKSSTSSLKTSSSSSSSSSPTKASSSSSTPKSSTSSSAAPTSTTTWTRQGYYNSTAGTSTGLTFLNLNGGSPSGIWDAHFGSSLSYSTPSGTGNAASPQTLADTTLPSTAEVILFTNRTCASDNACGYYRPGTVAYHGFGGASKIFLLEFSMPLNASTANTPAVWALNALIPRTNEYGTCQCWANAGGCGELDFFEVLDAGETRMVSNVHGAQAGGDSDYFVRPTQGTLKAAVVMTPGQLVIKVLSDSFVFGSVLAQGDLVGLGGVGDIYVAGNTSTVTLS